VLFQGTINPTDSIDTATLRIDIFDIDTDPFWEYITVVVDGRRIVTLIHSIFCPKQQITIWRFPLSLVKEQSRLIISAFLGKILLYLSPPSLNGVNCFLDGYNGHWSGDDYS